MPVRALVWGENIHERTNSDVAAIYPDGMHACIAEALAQDPEIVAATATLQEPEHGLTAARLEETDVLLWWGHAAHGDVADPVVDRVQQRIWEGMGLIALHSAHFSKIFKRMMGSPCSLKWREAGERERIWVVDPAHPIATGLGPAIELEHTEMYGEPFAVPEPLETVFVSWFQGGEVLRSGMTWKRGGGRIFYFAPGHEVYPIYHNREIQQVLRNAVRWAHNPGPRQTEIASAPNVPSENAPEPIAVTGPSLHKPGEEGFR